MSRKNLHLPLILIIASLLMTGCQIKNPFTPSTPANLQEVGQLPKVDLKPVKPEDPSTYPPRDFVTLTNDDQSVYGGDAYRTYENNKFVFKVAAQLPELTSGQQYQSWLVNPTTKKFLSTGTLTKTSDRWTVTFTAEQDAKEFTHVVITSGQNVTDPGRSKAIVSGDFVN